MTKEEIIEMARQAGFLDYELDDGTTDAFDKRYEAFARLVAKRTWVGLTYEEKHEIRYSHMTSAEFIEFIEAKLKDKNTRGQE